MIDFRMQTFITVCSCMNYTKAAALLHITQPAVTQHIQYLEQHYQTKLFIHDGKRIQLSPAGELLLRHATAYQNDDKLVCEMIHVMSKNCIPLNFGVTLTIGEYMMADPLSRYIKAHPESTIDMTVSNTSDLLTMLKNGKIHFALIEGFFDREDYAYLPHSTEDFICVCSSHHQFIEEPSSICSLLNEHIIVRESGSGTRDILEKNLEASNLKLSNFKHVTQINSMHTIIRLIEEDCGITFLYKTAVKQAIENGTIRELPLNDFHVRHDFNFIWNKESMFHEEYKEMCRQLMS